MKVIAFTLCVCPRCLPLQILTFLIILRCSFLSLVCVGPMNHLDQIKVNLNQSLDFSWDLRHILNLYHCLFELLCMPNNKLNWYFKCRNFCDDIITLCNWCCIHFIIPILRSDCLQNILKAFYTRSKIKHLPKWQKIYRCLWATNWWRHFPLFDPPQNLRNCVELKKNPKSRSLQYKKFCSLEVIWRKHL